MFSSGKAMISSGKRDRYIEQSSENEIVLTVHSKCANLLGSKINFYGGKMFKVGDLAVYPAQGVGIIEAIENRDVGGSEQLFYIMKIMGNGMKIMIPMASAKSVGLREVIMETEIPKVYAILRNKDVTIDKQTWNKRYREYLEKIKTGSVFEIARVLRDLFILKNDKNLSFGERKMMDTAKNLLIKEISVASNAEETKVEEDLKTIFTIQ
jgi:CarD family transcriptional regulator